MVTGRRVGRSGERTGIPAVLAFSLSMASMALALAACSVGPDYHRPDTPSPARWQAPTREQPPTGEESLDPAPRSGEGVVVWPADGWWRSFGSTALDGYIAQARAANLDLAAAAARVRQADAQARIAGAPLLPSFGFGANGTQQRAFSGGRHGGYRTYGGASPLFNASYQVDFWGRYADAATAAGSLALSSRYDQETVALTVLSGVATTYFQVLGLRDRLTVAQDNLDTAQSVLDGLRAQAAAGIATALDVAQQETEVATLRAALPPLREQLGRAVDALAVLLGRLPEGLTPGPGTLAQLKIPEVRPGLPSELLVRRPDVAAAQAQLVAGNATVKAAIGQLYPSFSLTAEGGTASALLGSLANPASGVFSVAAGLTQPIFEGGALQGQVDLTRAQYEELVADYRKAVVAAFANVEDALTSVAQAGEEERRQGEAAATARRAYGFAREQMNAGTINILTVLNTQTTLFTAQDALVQARLAHLQALVSLYAALGGGWRGL